MNRPYGRKWKYWMKRNGEPAASVTQEKMKRILLFSLLSTLLLTSCMAVQVVGSVAGGAVMVSGYALGANAVTKKVKKKKDKKKKVQKEEALASQLTEEQQRKYDYFFWKPCG